MKEWFISSHGIADLARRTFKDCRLLLDIGSGNESQGLTPLKNIIANIKIESLDIDERIMPDIVSDAASIPRSDNHYDGIFACHILEHLNNPEEALKEWRRVLMYGGVLLVIVPFESIQKGHKQIFSSTQCLSILAKKTYYFDVKCSQRMWVRFGQTFFGSLLKKGDLVMTCKK